MAIKSNLADCNGIGEVYSLPIAALLWCGLSIEEAEQEAAAIKDHGKGIYSHPEIPCLINKTRAFTQAIAKGDLKVCREDGINVAPNDHVAPNRRHFRAEDLKSFISTHYPNSKPAFLFSEEEQKPAINLAEYQRMNAEYTKLQAELGRLETKLAEAQSQARDFEAAKKATDSRLENAIEIYRQQQAEIQALKAENEELKKPIPKTAQLKAENKQAEIIAAIACLYTKTDCSQPYEAAETIRQEWERKSEKLGNPPTSDTIVKYIKQGIERIKP